MTSPNKFADIEVGFALTALTKQITQEKINIYAEAAEDDEPIHIDPEFAVTTVFNGTIAHGLLSAAYLSEMLTNSFGKLWYTGGKLDLSFLQPVRPGDTITARGFVTEIKQDAHKLCIVLDIFCENQRAEKVISGTASCIIK